jgi:hypothetical protein
MVDRQRGERWRAGDTASGMFQVPPIFGIIRQPGILVFELSLAWPVVFLRINKFSTVSL